LGNPKFCELAIKHKFFGSRIHGRIRHRRLLPKFLPICRKVHWSTPQNREERLGTLKTHLVAFKKMRFP
jgi:hypothetical protein